MGLFAVLATRTLNLPVGFLLPLPNHRIFPVPYSHILCCSHTLYSLMLHFFKSYLELVSRWPIGEPTSQPYIVGANDLICSRYSHIFDIESNQYNRSLLFFIGNNHSFICSINIEWLWWSGYCDRSIFQMQCPTHWSDLNGGSFRHLGRQAFWLLSSHINSMDIDSAYLKKIVMEFDFYCEKNNIFRLI